MKQMKKLLSAALVLCTVLAMAGPAGATNAVTTPTDPIFEERLEFIPVENVPISSGGVVWDCTAPYVNARIYVYNDTSVDMKVTITIDRSVYDIYTVPAGKGLTQIYNNMDTGVVRMNFSTSTGELGGAVGVRLSDSRF